jgi:hypothetical protein
MAIAWAEPQEKLQDRLTALALSVRNRLFDRNDEARDQPRDFVQMVAILIGDGLCQPNEAFVIAQRGQAARSD